jgi:hypothetical protein
MIIKKAILKAWYSGTFTATVQISGSGKSYLEGVAVARNIPSAEMVSGRRVAVLFQDKSNPADAVVIAVYS